MNIREHEGFQIQIHKAELGYIAEIYRKGNLLKTVCDDKGAEVLPFKTMALAFEAARGWINQTYSKRIKYKSDMQVSLPDK